MGLLKDDRQGMTSRKNCRVKIFDLGVTPAERLCPISPTASHLSHAILLRYLRINLQNGGSKPPPYKEIRRPSPPPRPSLPPGGRWILRSKRRKEPAQGFVPSLPRHRTLTCRDKIFDLGVTPAERSCTIFVLASHFFCRAGVYSRRNALHHLCLGFALFL